MAETEENDPLTEIRVLYGQCRCCLINGHHRDMRTYFGNDVRETYFDQFVACFNLNLRRDSILSSLICSSCVQKLQEAHQFKSMVIDSESRLLQVQDKQGTAFDNIPEINVTVKCEEYDEPHIEDMVYDDGTDNFKDQDLLVQPQPQIEETNGLVEGEAELLARHKFAKLLPDRDALHLVYPEFAHQLKMLKRKVIKAKSLEKMLIDPNDKNALLTEKNAHITNAATLLLNSNATPFRSRTKTGFPCFYCKSTFETLKDIKEHIVNAEHKRSELVPVFNTYSAEGFIVYADITDLKCTICDQEICKIEELKSHLRKQHNKDYLTDFTDRVIPFKLSDDNVYECQVCGFSFETFGSIERHMNVHYRNYVCEKCGTGFVMQNRLKVHIKSTHADGKYPCGICGKIFQTPRKLKNHIDIFHKMLKRFACTKCHEKFMDYFQRQRHMESAHGVARQRYKCNVCDKSFNRRYILSCHLKRNHLEERDFQCEMCSHKCFNKKELRAHMIKHTGERIHECSVCKKSYSRKPTLVEHMRIHNNDRRYVCNSCGQAFIQSCNLKGHMKTHHVENRVFQDSVSQQETPHE